MENTTSASVDTIWTILEDASRTTLIRAIGTLHKTKNHSDVTLRARDGELFKTHQAILCSQSGFFARALKPDKFMEGNTGHIDLEVGDSDTCSNSCPDSLHSFLFRHAELQVAADFYGIEMLHTIAQFRLQLAFDDFCKDAILEADLKLVPDLIRYIYDRTYDKPGAIRYRLTAALVKNLPQMYERSSNFKAGFEGFLASHAEFRVDFEKVQD